MSEVPAMNRLKRIQVRGYKSIRKMDLELGQINVLIGANAAGKSNFVSLFRLLRARVADDPTAKGSEFHEYVEGCGGANALLYYGAKTTQVMEFTLEFEVCPKPYHWLLKWAIQDAFTETEHDDLVQPSRGTGKLEPVVEQCRVFQFHDTSPAARIRINQYINDNRGLASDGGNLAAFLYMLQETQGEYYRRILDTIRDVAPHFGDFELAPHRRNADTIRLDWREAGSEYLFGPHQLPDGLLRFMALATLLLQPNDTLPEIVIIDEPELGLHPYAINVLGGLVRKAAAHCQLILATQSVNLLDQFEPEHIVTVERHRLDGQYESVFRRVDPGELAEWLEEYSLSELWEKNVIGGRPTR
ncbi:MAG: AAA family ATPase [Candidatus Brocadiae bacterium]|nr:AAA family ATPase [Candidatus Brocadiia bacterium]